MTKERKIYAALLGLVVAGLLIDQVLLKGDATGPKSATAGLSTPTSSPAAGGPDLLNVDDVVKKMNQAAATLSDEHTLSHRLERFAAERKYELPRVNNAFKPDASWVDQATTKTATPAAKVIESFRAAHKLTGVMVTSQGGVAMVESKSASSRGGALPTPLRVGQTLDGLTLMSVTDNTATFAGAGVELTLTLALPAGAASPQTSSPTAAPNAGSSGNLPPAALPSPGLIK
jgi:hypothetical protein